MAETKTILVYATKDDTGAELLREAAAFASARKAHLVVLAVGFEPMPLYGGPYDVPVEGYLRELQAARDEVRDTVAWANERLADSGASFEVRGVVASTGTAGAAIARQARYADIAVLPRDGADGNWHRLVYATLFESGRPVILWPRGASLERIGNRVAIGWDASREASRAVRDALDLLAGAKDIRIVALDPQVGIDGHGEDPGTDLATMLARHGLSVTVDAIPRQNRSVADAILSHAQAMDADLIVIGAYGHSRLSEIILGGVTRDLMEATERPLMMSH